MAATFNPFTGQLDFTGGSSSVAAFTSGTATGLTGLGIRSTGAAFDLKLASAEVLTAGRTLTFNVGNADRTLTIPATGTAALLGAAQTFSAANIFSVNGAASTPAVSITGSVFTGGSATTTKPLFLVEPTGTTSTGWSTSGTLIGANAASGFTGDIAWFGVNGVANIRIVNTQTIGTLASTVLAVIDATATLSLAGSVISSSRSDGLYIQYAGAKAVWFCNATSKIGDKLLNFNEDVGIARASAGNMKITNGSSGYGTIDASGYSASGTAGVTAGPFTVITGITVKNGLVTALTGS